MNQFFKYFNVNEKKKNIFYDRAILTLNLNDIIINENLGS
jgi:hypothetical protein